MTENQHPIGKPSQADSGMGDPPKGEDQSADSWDTLGSGLESIPPEEVVPESLTPFTAAELTPQVQSQAFEAAAASDLPDVTEGSTSEDDVTGVLDAAALEQVLFGPDSGHETNGPRLPSFEDEPASPYGRAPLPSFSTASFEPLASEPLASNDRTDEAAEAETTYYHGPQPTSAPGHEMATEGPRRMSAQAETAEHAAAVVATAPVLQVPPTTAQATPPGPIPVMRQAPIVTEQMGMPTPRGPVVPAQERIATPRVPIQTAEVERAAASGIASPEADPRPIPTSSLAPSATSMPPQQSGRGPATTGSRRSPWASVGLGVLLGLLLAVGASQYQRLRPTLVGPNESHSEVPGQGPAEGKPSLALAAPPPATSTAAPTPPAAPPPNANDLSGVAAAPAETGRATDSLALVSPTRASARRVAKETKGVGTGAAAAATGSSEEEVERGDRTPEGFNEHAATNAIAYASRSLSTCRDPEIGRISTRADVTFAPSGHVTQVTLQPTLAMRGSPMIACVVQHLREALVPQFSGERVTVHTIVTVD